MKVLRMEAREFCRLSFVEITPNGNSVVLSGKNAQGKSSVIAAVLSALGGKSAAPARPVHEGSESAEVIIDLGDAGETKLRVTKKFEGTREKLLVENAEGTHQGAPQGLLDSLRGAIGFDPLSFADPPGAKTEAAKDKERLAMIAQVAPLPIDLDEWKRNRDGTYQARTEANRVLKDAKARIPDAPSGPEPQRVDVAKMMERLSAAEKLAESRRAAEMLIDAKNAELRATLDKIEELRETANRLRSEEAECVRQLAEINVPDVADLRETISRASTQNEEASAYQRTVEARENAQKEHARAQARVDELNAKLKELDDEKATALASVTLPADGLSIDENGVLLNGLPFASASTAERIAASVRVAAAMNPGLRVAIIRDGNALDSDSMADLMRFAEEADLQLWVERVVADVPGAIEIEDGTVREAVTA